MGGNSWWNSFEIQHKLVSGDKYEPIISCYGRSDISNITSPGKKTDNDGFDVAKEPNYDCDLKY